MMTLPAPIMTRLNPVTPLFTRRTWRHVPLLVAEAIFAPGRRMASSVLRVTGHGDDAAFSTYHRVLNRAVWSSLGASRILFDLLIATFVPAGPLTWGIDETLKRRYGQTITAAGIYRDPIRSSHGHFVKARALRWVSLMLLVPIPWVGCVWALPFLAVLAPSERYDPTHQHRHNAFADWARQMARVVHRWCPARPLVLVENTAYAALELLAATRLTDPTTTWTPLTVPFWSVSPYQTIEIVSGTALWYSTGLPPVPVRWVLIRDPANAFPPQALLCTDRDADPVQIVSWVVVRWQRESTFHEVREHVTEETGRGWSVRTSRVRFPRPVFVRYPGRPSSVGAEYPARQGGGLIPQAGAHPQRCPCQRASLLVDT